MLLGCVPGKVIRPGALTLAGLGLSPGMPPPELLIMARLSGAPPMRDLPPVGEEIMALKSLMR